MKSLYCVSIVLMMLSSIYAGNIPARCHDPSLAGHRGALRMSEKRFLLISGAGAGIGNFLIFFPAAYYFAALTGREILIMDQSIIGEMCKVLHCGFPLYNEIATAYPSVLNQDMLNNVRGAKVGDFHRHMAGEVLLDDKLVRADGFMEQSGWYFGHPFAVECVSQISGCGVEDVSCHDRHALQQLVRGPFKTEFSAEEEKKIVGVPPNFKHGMLTLPHKYAPRLDAAVHLRCQFQHFEWLVGKEDTMWANYVKEVDDWLYSTDENKGQGLFREVERKIMQELHVILERRKQTQRRRQLAVTAYIKAMVAAHESIENRAQNSRRLDSDPARRRLNATQLQADLEHEQEVYHGADDQSDRVYVYLAADNERVKEAFAEFLLGHHNISVMRVRTGDIIVHAKNTGYLRQTTDGVMALVVDWYALSLANVLFAWRRDTAITSTFARSAQKVSGNSDSLYMRLNATTAGEEVGPAEHARMFQLNYGRSGNPVWGEH